VPIEYNNLPPSYVVDQLNPPEVEVTFSGPRRSFYFMSASKIRVFLKLFNAQQGTTKRTIPRTNVVFPEGLSLENVQPADVTVTIKPREQ
jgi:YbbR domain-containing protein